MKNLILSILLLMSSVSFAQRRPLPAPAPESKSTGYLVDQGIAKSLISFEYNSWLEKLTITNSAGAQQDSKAQYYGFSLGYEQNFYQPRWGWGFGGAVGMGTSVGGDKAGSLQYFENRVPWTTVRFVPRLFYRWNPQTDLGIDIVSIYKTAKWPDEVGGRNITSGSQIVAGPFVDLRVRFNAKIEMIQSFGTLYKNESMYWRLGLGYRL